jgi:outer membrane phospholipase A
MNQQLKALNLFYVASWHFMLMTCWGCGNPNSETYHKAEAELKQSFNFRTWQKALRILYPYDT